MKRIAIYGKGGIGKSTLTSNISAAMALLNQKVLQIGCDPKHDSTRILVGDQPTVLETIVAGSMNPAKDTLRSWKEQVFCLEIGGPKPGIGCAGRGIIKGIGQINSEHLAQDLGIDICIYDVLGDVVCGGFFEPIRNGSAQEIYLVTSGEFNSLFAANNICQGFTNSIKKANGPRICGIIANYRGADYEAELVREFSIRVNTPVIHSFSRDNRIERSNIECAPVAELYPNSDITESFLTAAQKILSVSAEDREISPMTFPELKELYYHYCK